jgi:hypothetical protein
MRGIVMDVKRKYVIVMSSDGGFYHARKEEAYSVGKEILFTPLPEKSQLFSFSNWKVKMSSFAAACTVIGGILFTAIPRAVPVYAYVSVDINPSVEFSVGNNWTVIKTTFTNQDGKELLSTLPNTKGESIDAAIDQFISAAKKEGKLQDNGDVWITGVLANQSQTETPVKNELKQLQTEFETKEKVQVQIGTTTKKIRSDAVHLGVSPGKYVYYQNAAKSGNPISLQSVKNDSATKLDSVAKEKSNTKVAANPVSHETSKAQETNTDNHDKNWHASQNEKQATNESDSKNTEKETSSNTWQSHQEQNGSGRQNHGEGENQHKNEK